MNKFNINYSKTLNPPNLQKYYEFNDFLISLIIGFIDGDGHIRKLLNQNSFQLTLENHSAWYDFYVLVENTLREKFGGTYIRSFIRTNNRGYICQSISSKYILRGLYQFILENNLPVLTRKWSVLEPLLLQL